VKPIVFLDLDGVCCDWAGSAAALFRRDNIYSKPWTTGYWVHDFLGVPEATLRKTIEERGISFWRNLTPYDHFYPLLRGLQLCTDLYFCSSPGSWRHAAEGKREWVRHYAPDMLSRLILIDTKELLGQPGRCLIDDYEVHLNEFEKTGGNSMLFPAPWNALSSYFLDSAGNRTPATAAEAIVQYFQGKGAHAAGV
jgi:5'(3')-deoxyribonucleotidase